MILERLFGESFIKVASCTDTRSSSLTPLLTMPPSALLAVSLWGVQIEYTGMDGAFLARSGDGTQRSMPHRQRGFNAVGLQNAVESKPGECCRLHRANREAKPDSRSFAHRRALISPPLWSCRRGTE